jgi:hypothetical protein
MPSSELADTQPSPNYARMDTLPMPLLDDDRGQVVAQGYGVTKPPENFVLDTVDPNQKYEDSLSAVERSQYSIVFRGVDIYAANFDPYAAEVGGCIGEANAANPDPTEKWASKDVRNVFADQTTDLRLFFTTRTVNQDARTIKLNREWRSCMVEQDQLLEIFRVNAKVGEGGFLDGPEGAFLLASMTSPDGSVASLDADGEQLPVNQKALVGSQAEIGIALADFDCRTATSYLARLTEIQRSLEQDFVDARKNALDQMVAYVDQETN